MKISTELLLTALLCGSSQTSISIGGVPIGSTEAAALQALGRPITIQQGDGFIKKTYVYRLTRVKFDEDGLVAGIETRDHTKCYDQLICPGQSIDLALGRNKMKRASDKKGYSSVYSLAEDGCWAEFRTKARTITSIEIFCPP